MTDPRKLVPTVPTLAALSERHHSLRSEKPSSFTLRMHRALSWLERADRAADDDDVGFLCLWIAFNAAYAQDSTQGIDSDTECQALRSFISEVCALDERKSLSTLVWQVFEGPIRVLLDDHYLFQPFWNAINHPRPDGSVSDYWKESFDAAHEQVNRAFAQKDTERVLHESFVRLHTLHNQLLHGGATWDSCANRVQVRDGRALLAQVLPVMLGIMMGHPACFEGKPFYVIVP